MLGGRAKERTQRSKSKLTAVCILALFAYKPGSAAILRPINGAEGCGEMQMHTPFYHAEQQHSATAAQVNSNNKANITTKAALP